MSVALVQLAPPQVQRVGLGYRLMGPDRIALGLDRIHESRGEVSGELTVSQDGEHIYRGRFNVSSLTSRKTTAAYLRERGGEQGWARLLETFCVAVLDAHRQGEEVVAIGGGRVSAERRPMLLDPLLALDEPTILYGRGGVGKTYLAAALAVSVSLGREVVPGVLPCQGVSSPCRPGRVLVIDYESSAADWDARLTEVARGAGVDDPEVAYRRGIATIASSVAELAALRAEGAFDLVVVDSVGMAAGQGHEGGDAAETTHRLFDAIRAIGGTWLLIDHVAASAFGEDDTKPYGSVFKLNRARAVFELRAASEPDGDSVELLLRQTKVNNARLLRPMGLVRSHGEGSVAFQRADVSAPELERLSGSIAERMARLLRSGALGRKEIAEALDLPDTVQVRNVLRRDRQHPRPRFLELDGGRVGLAR